MEPQEYPLINRDGRIYSFLDCICTETCLGRDCVYCAFELPERICPAYGQEVK